MEQAAGFLFSGDQHRTSLRTGRTAQALVILGDGVDAADHETGVGISGRHEAGHNARRWSE